MNTQELFPETLLVSREGEHIYTTSRSVAFHFGKRHDTVLRVIRKILLDVRDDEFGRRNFAATSYLDEWNRPQPEYHLTKAGFMFVALRFTGQEAAVWQRKFIEAFERMESELADHHARRIAALDALHPNLLPTVEDYERGLPRCTTAQRLGRSVAAVTYHRRKARRLGLLAAPAARGQA